MDETGVDGLVTVVTGGAAGIGLATARLLSGRGARVTTLDVAGAPEGAGWEHRVADLRDTAAVEAAVQAVADRHGPIDVLVNNAGVSFVGGVEAGSEEDWHRLWDINVLGSVRTIRAALPHLRRARQPVVINVISCTTASGIPERSLYSATKGALRALTLSMAADLIREGVRVTAVSPGTVDTPFMAELAERDADPEARRRQFAQRQPLGRMVRPEEVAGAIAYLASPIAAATVGTVLTVDGGMETLRVPPPGS